MRDRNVLTACMVDGDSSIVLSYRRSRRKALLLAIALEAALLAALLLVPLASPSVLPRRVTLTPSPPYHGDTASESDQHTDVRPPVRGHRTHYVFVLPSPGIPPHTGAPSSPGDSDANVLPPLRFDNSGPPGPAGSFDWTGPAPRVDTPPPPRPRPTLRRIHSGGEVEQALLLHRVEPRYPALARQIRLEGTVRLHAVIGIDGVVRELEVENGHPLLVQAALEAVRQWRYRPTRLNGQPVEVETTITVIFELGP